MVIADSGRRLPYWPAGKAIAVLDPESFYIVRRSFGAGRQKAARRLPGAAEVRVRFAKYHGLGNDYLVIEPAEIKEELAGEQIRAICHRHYGLGSDGILIGPQETAAGFGVRIFNPDGSEAEKSGNGLRIFARYLWDSGRVAEVPFVMATLGGRVEARVLDAGARVTVEMGRVDFAADRIPVTGQTGPVLNREKQVDGQTITWCAATVGNPHCIVLCDEISRELAERLGPVLENDPAFPRRANVQFLKVIDRATVALEIWERGAGYTLACGSAASVAAACARRLDKCDAAVAVIMPGGRLDIVVADDYSVRLTGPVVKIAEGRICQSLFDSFSEQAGA